jgi:hypothetical protein
MSYPLTVELENVGSQLNRFPCVIQGERRVISTIKDFGDFTKIAFFEVISLHFPIKALGVHTKPTGKFRF